VAAMLCRYDRQNAGDTGWNSGTGTSPAARPEPEPGTPLDAGELGRFPFRVLPPHSTEEFLTGNLSPNDIYTLVLTEEYTDTFFTITSENVKIVETVSTLDGWELRTKAEGTVFLKVTNQRTGQQRRLTVGVGTGQGDGTDGSIWPGVDAVNPFQSAVEYPDGPGPYRAERLEIIRLANEVRVRHGANECVVSEVLMSDAQKLAEMKPQGHDEIAETQRRRDFGCFHGVGCNLYRSTNAGKVRYLPPSAVRLWDQSPGHHDAMVNKGADSMGIGLCYDEETKTAYCVMYVGGCQAEGQLFGNPHN
ncbi:MAG: CAP domain-containing protein, partial [Abditibacteriota bacterium]|nr:CAP domain-containing protein [Abditibacteriota bacterium]